MRSTLNYHPTGTPLPLEGHHEMLEPFRFSATEYLVQDRIHELREIAAGLRAIPLTSRSGGSMANIVVRTRALVGRRLISLGSAVAGQHAARARPATAPRRR